MYALYGHDVMLDGLVYPILHTLHTCGIVKTNPRNYLEQFNLTGTVSNVFIWAQNYVHIW